MLQKIEFHDSDSLQIAYYVVMLVMVKDNFVQLKTSRTEWLIVPFAIYV